MGTSPSIPAPNIVQDALAVSQAPTNAYAQDIAIQGEQQQQQERALQMHLQRRQMADQDALTKTISSYDPTKNTLDDIPKMVTKNGGSGMAALQAQAGVLQQRLNYSKLSDAQFAQEQHKADLIQGIHDQVTQAAPEDKQNVYAQGMASLARAGVDVSKEPAQYPGDDVFAQHLPAIRLHSAVLAEAEKDRELSAKETQAAAEQQKAQQGNWKEAGPGTLLNIVTGEKLTGNVPPEQAEYQAYLQKGGKPEGWTAYKAQQEAAATQPFKMQTAQADAQARFSMEGMTKPVYAWNPLNNQKDLMNQTEALAQGRKVMTPVTAKEVSEDTMLINRLSDVRQKIAEYENALQQPISQKDRGNMAALLGTSQTKVGVHPHGVLGGISFEVPMERLDAALSQENLSGTSLGGGLSANARDQIVAYRNAREALTGYTRVLSGSGRSSDKNLELQEQTLPDPTFTDPDFSRRSLGAFKQNLRVVGQGLPNIPGIKNPEQWEQEATSPAGNSMLSIVSPGAGSRSRAATAPIPVNSLLSIIK